MWLWATGQTEPACVSDGNTDLHSFLYLLWLRPAQQQIRVLVTEITQPSKPTMSIF